MTWLDLNADLGEGVGDDPAMMALISSASIACGGHAGDDFTMRLAIRSARERGVVVGAHPGFPDRETFGRRRLLMPPAELDASIRAQVSALIDIAADEGVAVRYVKLHGALANMAAEDPAVAMVAFAACKGLADDLAVLAIDHSAQVEVAELLGFPVIREAYADRAYQPDGLLVPRSEPGAVIHEPLAVAARALQLAEQGEMVAIDGSAIPTDARSLCIHGDTPDAVAMARAVRSALEGAGIEVRSAAPAIP